MTNECHTTHTLSRRADPSCLVEFELTLAWSTVAVIPVLTTDIAFQRPLKSLFAKVLFILKQSPHPLGRILVEYTRP